MNNNKMIIIAGPTCVGKTKLGIILAKDLNAEIISTDSMQVYKDLNIGVAKANKEEQNNIKHYMIDEVYSNINFNIKDFKDKANIYINEIYKKNKLPILVGGTGFYINAVLYDNVFMDEDRDVKSKINYEINLLLEKKGINYLYNLLKEVDIDSYNTIHINNQKRIIRALEFYYLHNKPISLHNEEEKKRISKYNYLFIFLNDDRNILYKNINKRVDDMFDKGLIFEAYDLINKGALKNSNAMNAIGYKELYDYLLNFKNKNIDIHNIYNDNIKNDENFLLIKEKIKQHSRNYAKRQITWFKSQKNIVEINISDFKNNFYQIGEMVKNLYKKL